MILLRGIAFNPFSVPPNVASLLLLSLAIKASNPSLTSMVFSLIPVSLDALSTRLSSMFKVVLIFLPPEREFVCLSMHTPCIHVKLFADNRGADPWNEACGVVGACKRVTTGPVPCSGARGATGQSTGRSRHRDSARRSRAERKDHRARQRSGELMLLASLGIQPIVYIYIIIF